MTPQLIASFNLAVTTPGRPRSVSGTVRIIGWIGAEILDLPTDFDDQSRILRRMGRQLAVS